MQKVGKRSALLGSVAFMLAAAPALGQQVAKSQDEVVVTGSRIVSGNLQSNSPLTTTDDEDLELRGTTNIESALVELPQVIPGSTSTDNNGSNGTTTVNLRGLGDIRTLVLVDGKRWVPSGTTGVVDLNTIPVALLKRVEVVSGGASAVYGSDALAGVVNFILKDDFEGVQLDAGYRITGDGETYDTNILIGGNFADDRGNAVLWGGYTKRNAIFQGDRDFSSVALAPNATDDGLIPSGSTTSFPANLVLSAPGNSGIDTDGDGTVTFGAGGALVDPASVYNFAPVNYLQVPQKRYTGGAMVTYEINRHAELFGRVALANNQVSTQLAPTGTFFASFGINPDNPFLPQSTIDALRVESGVTDPDANVIAQLGYRFPVPRFSEFTRDAFQLMSGVRGEINDSWSYEVFAQYSRTDLQTYLTGDANLDRVQQAFLVRNVDGSPQCIDPSDGCAPLNIFSDNPEDVTQKALDFIALQLAVNANTEEKIAGGFVSGDLGERFVSPWAESPIAVSAGLEYREVSSEYRPDANYAGGRSAGFGTSAVVVGGFDVAEVYGEAVIPIVENRLFFQNLSLEGGYRFSEYSNSAGQVNTFKAGGTWEPVSDIRFRALFQRAVRAPNINELFQPIVENSPTGADPCAGNNPAGSRDLCIATGVPADRYGSVPLPPAGQFQSFNGGNPDLQVEKSNTWTAGFVLRPSALPGFNATVDYYTIEITDAIGQLAGGAQNTLDACYLEVQDANSVYCQAITRNQVNGSLFGGNVTGVRATSVNTGLLKTSGIDFSANYSREIGSWGDLDFSLAGVWVESFERQGDPVLPKYECAGRFGSVCDQITPDLKTSSRLTWLYDALTLSVRWRRVGEVELDRIALGLDSNGRAPVEEIDAQDYFDLEGSYRFDERARLTFGVSNVFENDPPVFGRDVGGANATANTYPGTYDALGRVFHAKATVNF